MEANVNVQGLLLKCKGHCTKGEILKNIQELVDVLNEGRNVGEPNVAQWLVKLAWDIINCERNNAGFSMNTSKTRQSGTNDSHVIIFILRIISQSFAPQVAAAIFQKFLRASQLECPDIVDVINIPQRDPLEISRPSIHHLNLTTNALVKGTNLHFLISPSTKGESLILELLDVIVKLCLDLRIPHFQAIMALLIWVDAVERIFKAGLRISNELRFVPETLEVEAITAVVAASWESPVNGVSDLAKKIYASLLRLHVLEKKTSPDACPPDLHGYLLAKTMRMPWTAKPKFQSLACLLQYVDFEQCIALDPKLPDEVIGCLTSTHLTSVAADVYKMSIVARNKEVDKDTWTKHWKEVIASAISSDSRVQRHNLTTHLLPWTLQNVPSSFADISTTLKEEEKLRSTSLVTLSRIAKQAGVIPSLSEGRGLIHNFLHHESNEVRAEVFGLLCSCHAKSQLPTAEEFESIARFLPENLNVDDAWFRTEVTIHMENFVIRLRDLALTSFSRHKRQEGIKHDEVFAKIIGFIEWLVSLCTQNIYPGAGYQRLITCITLLETVFGTFSHAPKGKRKVIQRKDDMTVMLNYLRDTSIKLDPATGATHQAVMQCIFHGADDVRQAAFKILSSCNMTHARASYMTELVRVAKKYVSSPKAHDTAIGAALLHLYLIHVKDDGEQIEEGMRALFNIADKESKSVRRDFAEAAQHAPAHGAILALATCFSDAAILRALQATNLLDRYALNAVEVAKDLIGNALKVMRLGDGNPGSGINSVTGSDSTLDMAAAPSFEDTNRAFLQLVSAWEEAHGQMGDNEREILLEKMNSCSWLCIKNSCKLLEEVTRAWSEGNGATITLPYEAIEQIDAKFVDILFECRHRGAIESCYESYRAFCRLIALSENADIAELPVRNLRRLLLQVVKKTKSASVTRRSAGLPLLKRALVESKPDNSQYPLLSYAVDELEKAARSPLSDVTDADQEVDVIQAEALHILCSLVGAASLSCAMLPHLGRILRLTVDMLSAPRWVIVNAAHQLYGAVMPRLLGQKKTKEVVGHNTMTAAELFSRYPELRGQFLACLEGNRLCGRKDTMFVLDFLSRLTPTTFTSKEQEDLEPFLKCLDGHLGCDSWSQRLLAAKCYRLLCTASNSELRRLFDILVEGESVCSVNRTQAVLHLLNLLLRDSPHLAVDLGNVYEDRLVSQFARALSNDSHLICVEFLELLERVLPWKESRWRHLVHENFIDHAKLCPVGSQLPGRSMWKLARTKWLLKNEGDRWHTSFTNILTISEHDADVMEGVLTHLAEDAGSSGLRCSERLRQLVAATLVRYCGRNETYCTLKVQALEVLERLFETECIYEESLLEDCCKMCRRHATQDAPGGTTVRALSLLLWAACIKHLLSDQVEKESRRILHELEQLAPVLNSFAQWSADEVLRLHAARSLGTVGHLLLRHVAQYSHLPTKCVYGLFSSFLLLLQDENEEARKHAAKTFCVIAEDGHSVPVQPNIAIKELFKWLLSVCRGRAESAIFLADQLKTVNPTDVDVTHLSRSNSASLFEQEDVNCYAEPLVIVAVVQEHAKVAIGQVADENKKELRRYFLHEGLAIMSEARKTLSLLQALRDDLASLDGRMFGESRLQLALSMLHARMCICLLALEAAGTKDSQDGEVVEGLESQRKKLLEVWTPQLP